MNLVLCFTIMILIPLFSLIPDTITRIILVTIFSIILTAWSAKMGENNAINNIFNRHKFNHKLRGICPKEEDES